MSRTAAVILAGGSGKRMGTAVPKQYLPLGGKPLICHTLQTFQDSFIDELVLVVTPGDEEKCRRDLVEKYGFSKVRAIVSGGKERYHSVMNGVKAVSEEAEFIFIHDGARALVKEEVLLRALEDVKIHRASVVAVPAKDTVKIADAEDYVVETPKRTTVWQMQTPQVFEATLIREAYGELEAKEQELLSRGVEITDDAMIVELCTEARVHLVMGSYDNIKITTPEDLAYAEYRLDGAKKSLEKND